MKQQIKWNEETNEILLITKNSDNSITMESITSEQAAIFKAENI